MRPVIHFTDESFDVERLKQDLGTAETICWRPHFAKDSYTGSWDTIDLVSGTEEGARPGQGKHERTPLLRLTPYVEEILERFPCATRRVRFLRLGSGASIEKHRDGKLGWSGGVVRMHIPAITNDSVWFTVGRKRFQMRAGELWYVDVQRRHSVRNDGATDRVHLVFDLVVNDELRGFFPKESPLAALRDRIRAMRGKRADSNSQGNP